MTPDSSTPASSHSLRSGLLTEKDIPTIVVTDSGLGGLAVCAAIEQRMRAGGVYPKAHLVFANALPEATQGYNRMATTAEKVQVFDSALRGILRWYAPDVILVACNTLSVLLPETPFARESTVPLIGIVGAGVQMVYELLKADPESIAIIFGTETTIEMGTHRRLLVERGVDDSRLLTQACPNLAARIEESARGVAVRSAIDGFVTQALTRVRARPRSLYAALCCTHYGYSKEFFEESLRRYCLTRSSVVDPNERMADELFSPGAKRQSDNPRIEVEVVSRAVITPEESASIAALIESVSPPTARALRTHQLKKDLFVYTPAGPA